MLFSSDEVAGYINETYEAAWESLRPAAMVTIDLGNGHKIQRTLQGNIATYVCDPEGTVYDVLPGIYSPDVYLEQLKACRDLYESVTGPVGESPDDRRPTRDDIVARLTDYHARRAGALAVAVQPPIVKAIAQTGGLGKFGGLGLNQVAGPPFGGGQVNLGGFGGQLGNSQFGGVAAAIPTYGGIEGPTRRAISGQPPPPSDPASPKPSLPTSSVLAVDAVVNESLRRQAIHEKLAQEGAVRPKDIEKWLFKEVLKVDLDDPLLGLGEVLTENYPFAEEDRALEGLGSRPQR